MNRKAILNHVDLYYSEKLLKHGAGSLGVDWNSRESQYIRFSQLSNIIRESDYSLLDYGCGYGELLTYLDQDEKLPTVYKGFDISHEMINTATKLYGSRTGVHFATEINKEKFDYVLASGVFNVMPATVTKPEWKLYIFDTLKEINDISSKGFSFNILTSYSEKKFMKEYLFYADPLEMFDFCKKNFSRNVALLHDYDLYEFTILVRK